VEPETGVTAAIAGLSECVRRREQGCVDALLALYHFRPDDVDAAGLPLIDGRWEDDLFHPEALRSMGIKLGTGAAAGAAAGAGIDLMVGGLTLGAAAALGALAGGGWQVVRHYGERVFDKLRGQRELTVDDSILRLLAMRQLYLLRALEARGHAALAPIRPLDPELRQWREGEIPEPLTKARAHPHWSSLFGALREDEARDETVDALVAALSQAAER
jgi:hypothetical protein